jgi:hypothetical protein
MQLCPPLPTVTTTTTTMVKKTKAGGRLVARNDPTLRLPGLLSSPPVNRVCAVCTSPGGGDALAGDATAGSEDNDDDEDDDNEGGGRGGGGQMTSTTTTTMTTTTPREAISQTSGDDMVDLTIGILRADQGSYMSRLPLRFALAFDRGR